MKIQFTTKALLGAINKISKLTLTYKAGELYGTLKIAAYEDIVFEINSNVASMSTKTRGNIIEQGEVYIYSKDFISIIRAINAEQIVITKQGNRLVITGGNSQVELSTLEKNKFIKGFTISNSNKQLTFELNTTQLTQAILNCLPFENTKSLIGGLNLDIQNSIVRFCCCSELSACLYTISNANVPSDAKLNITIDTQFLKEFKDIFTDNNVDIDICHGFVGIQDSNTSLILRFLTKSFPNVEKIIPNTFAKELPLNKRETEQAFCLIDVVTKNIDARIEYKNKECIISHACGVSTKFNTEQDLQESFKIEREQLRKVLKLVNKDNITLLFNDMPKPIVIKEENKVFLVGVLVK